jgi:hypothetical protein
VLADFEGIGAQDQAVLAGEFLQVVRSGVEIPGTELTEHVREAFRDQEIQAVQHGYLASDLGRCSPFVLADFEGIGAQDQAVLAGEFLQVVRQEPQMCSIWTRRSWVPWRSCFGWITA